jgi:hypothetical protein
MERTELIIKKLKGIKGYSQNTFVNRDLDEAIALLEKPMHDYAGQSDSKQMKKHAIEFKTYIDDVEQFSLRALSDEERYNEYQAFLNREEKNNG